MKRTLLRLSLPFREPFVTAGGVVSVGAAGAERQVTNVAAGRISASSTDLPAPVGPTISVWPTSPT